jgi:hypothetical protein
MSSQVSTIIGEEERLDKNKSLHCKKFMVVNYNSKTLIMSVKSFMV